jgi:hypothetical protein
MQELSYQKSEQVRGGVCPGPAILATIIPIVRSMIVYAAWQYSHNQAISEKGIYNAVIAGTVVSVIAVTTVTSMC